MLARALHFFIASLNSPQSPLSTFRTPEGLVWLFFEYHQPAIALQAVEEMLDRGYNLSPQACVRVLREARSVLIFHPDITERVLEWLKQALASSSKQGDSDHNRGITSDTAELQRENEILSHHLTALLMETFTFSAQPEWTRSLFQSYIATLPPTSIAPPNLWSLLIKSEGESYGLKAAEHIFDTWRTAYHDLPRSNRAARPPTDPYVAILRQHARRAPPVKGGTDRAGRHIRLVVNDRLELTTGLFNALLALELTRRRYRSFWQLFRKMEASGCQKNESTWVMALKAVRWKRIERRRKRSEGASPLQGWIADNEGDPCGARELWSMLLDEHQARTGGRPRLVLPKSQKIAGSTKVYNLFLETFVDMEDWEAATVVLESFGIHRVEPSEATHSAVVLGVVKAWENDKLSVELREARALGLEPWKGRPRGVRDEAEGLRLLMKILEGREIRVGLWTRQQPQKGKLAQRFGLDAAQEDIEEGVLESGNAATKVEVTYDGDGTGSSSTTSAPPWMRQRELRSMAYLFDLLERCSGLNRSEWEESLSQSRRELLPRRTKGRHAQSMETLGDGSPSMGKRASTERYVFAHVVQGNFQEYTAEAWEADFALAKVSGIDAFAINVGGDASDPTQLDLAYTAAEATGMKAFISLDMTYTSVFGSTDNILSTYITPFADDGKVMLSTFSGENSGTYLDGNSDIQSAWASFKAAAAALASPVDIYFMPFWTGLDGSTAVTNHPVVDGIGQWLAWPTTDAAPSTGIDAAFQTDALNNGKQYIAPVSPWFYVHVVADNNYIYKSDDHLLATRYEQLLEMDTLPDFIEILTWNDYGESHYLGPVRDAANLPSGTDSSESYAGADFPHDGMLGLVAYYNQWYKTGTRPTVNETQVYMWYRLHPKAAVATSDALAAPTNADWTDDTLYAAVILAPGSSVTSARFSTGGVAGSVQSLAQGTVNKVSATFSTGAQLIDLLDESGNVVLTLAGQDISDSTAIYNFNYVATSATTSQ
ncbi:hypothetical protein MNV49_001456 [Pseudohyphozyma bogoriensis]|nr:hypothetical protein MNV49_001456 [Pseudohyphozyma bogoriensis]